MSKNPKISIVISVYNSEGFLKTALTSIQNQDFKDIEIIMIDDCSKDNSISLIKDLMKNDQRIILLQNKENRGCLYTKAQGVLHAKAKYVMTLDSDDIYSQRDTFTTLFFEAEKNNLDILGFASIVSGINIKRGDYIHRYMETPVVFQPEILNFMYKNKNGYVKRVGDVIWNYFFKTELFQKSIKQIDIKFFNIKMVYHDDFLFFFILTRNAKSLRQIKRVFYIMLSTPRKNNTIFQIHDDIKEKYKDNLCSSYLNYVEFILNKTNNTIEDKRIASYELNANFLDHECRNNEVVQKEGINICKLFLQNEYIENDIKDKIKLFLVEKNQNV
jgi:glycosyltransferase involved in cell wall biosynthesis